MGRMGGLLALAALALLIFSSGPPVTAQAARTDAASPGGMATVTLYLGGNSELTPTLPETAGSAPIPARAGGPLVWQVGAWKSQPLGAPLDFTGNITFNLWARATTPGQLNTRFQVYFGVNDVRGSAPYTTNSARLGTSPTEFKGTATVQLALNPADSIGFWVYVSERGTGGELLFGGSTPSRLEMAIMPLTINLTVSNGPGELKMAGNVTDIWGSSDISHIMLVVMGPFAEQNVSGRELYASRTRVMKEVMETQLKTEEEPGGGTLFSYTWRFDPAAVKTGAYLVLAMVETYSNASADASVWTPIVQPKAGFFGDSPILVIALVVISVVIGAATIIYLFRSGKIAVLLENRNAAVAVGAVVIIIVASVGIYLTVAPAQSTDKAPPFTLMDVNGRKVSLSDFKGSVVVLDMMATWCPTCNQEIPELKDFHAKHPEAIVISIDVDKTENSQQLNSHMQSKGANWIFCMDTGNVMSDYHVSNIPKIVIITPTGYVTYIKEGLVKSDELAKEAASARSGSAPILALGGEMGFATLAFLAGISAFFSPCAFPLLPGYMTYYLGREAGGEAAADRRKAVRMALIGGMAAAAGVLMVYGLMGLVVAGAGAVVKGYVGYLAPIVAAVVLMMGVVMLTSYTLPIYRLTSLFTPAVNALKSGLGRLTRRQGAEPGQYLGLMSYGAGYGAASLGCHAPIFIAVVMAGLVAGGVGAALLAFVMYAIGMGLFIVIVTVMVGMAKTQLVKRMQQWMPFIKKISGIVLIVVGLVLLYNFSITPA